MRLSDIGGEFGFIDRLRATYASGAGDGLVVSLGDDAAVLDVPSGQQLVVTTDLLLEGVHFRREWSDPYSIGWKAAAANLSDMAAMGADPTFAFVSLAMPAEETVETLERLYDGLTDCLGRYGARLAGGDTNQAPETLTVNIALLGIVPAGHAWKRSGARVGDTLLVTGTLGDSAAGLALLKSHGAAGADKKGRGLLGSHRRPHPRVAAARALRPLNIVRAAMDISDGLAGDLPKLCAASEVGAQVNISDLPVSEALQAGAAETGRAALEIALFGGEDFELLLCLSPADVEAAQVALLPTGTALTAIGRITREGLTLVQPDGSEEAWPEADGWDHFAP